MVNLSRMAEEIILWSSQEFGFVEVADEYSATSSIMPQKKNPVVAETIRAKCGSVLGELTASSAISKGAPERVQPRPPGDHPAPLERPGRDQLVGYPDGRDAVFARVPTPKALDGGPGGHVDRDRAGQRPRKRIWGAVPPGAHRIVGELVGSPSSVGDPPGDSTEEMPSRSRHGGRRKAIKIDKA